MRIGTTELLLILFIAFLLFGPSRLPQIGESIGKTIRSIRKELDPNAMEITEKEETDNR